jgi:hypothetical protein
MRETPKANKNLFHRSWLFAALMIGAAQSSHAATFSFNALLTGEVSGATGTGSINIVYDDVADTFAYDVVFSGLSSGTTVAHIHCCTASVGTGNAAPATELPSLNGFPTGVTSGDYDDVIDMTDAESFNPSFVTANGGTVTGALEALVAGMNAGTAYFNLHTSNNPTGEIRGFLVADKDSGGASDVPLPAGLSLLLTALGLLGLIGGRNLRLVKG